MHIATHWRCCHLLINRSVMQATHLMAWDWQSCEKIRPRLRPQPALPVQSIYSRDDFNAAKGNMTLSLCHLNLAPLGLASAPVGFQGPTVCLKSSALPNKRLPTLHFTASSQCCVFSSVLAHVASFFLWLLCPVFILWNPAESSYTQNSAT